MADRPDDSPVAPRRSLAGPGSQPDRPMQDTQPYAAFRDDTEELREDTARGTSEREPRPSGSERFAAAMATARGGKGSGESASGTPADRPGPTAGKGPARPTRKAHLRLAHVDPWSVMKTAFLLSIAVGVVMVVAVAVVWGVLGVAGVWDSIDRAVGDVLGTGSGDFTIQDYVGMSRVLGFTMIVAVVDVILLTVIATLAAFLYNLAAVLLGGVEVTLAEDDRAASSRG